MTAAPPGEPSVEQGAVTAEVNAPGLARERTALAWTRSALSIAASGALVARACFAAHLDVLATVIAILMAVLALVIWRHGQHTYAERLSAVQHRQWQVLAGLTTVTLFTALLAIIVTLAV